MKAYFGAKQPPVDHHTAGHGRGLYREGEGRKAGGEGREDSQLRAYAEIL